MKSFLDMLRWLRYGQASMSVAYYDAAVDRAKEGLALAMAARDAARIEIVIHEHLPTVPAFLRKA